MIQVEYQGICRVTSGMKLRQNTHLNKKLIGENSDDGGKYKHELHNIAAVKYKQLIMVTNRVNEYYLTIIMHVRNIHVFGWNSMFYVFILVVGLFSESRSL